MNAEMKFHRAWLNELSWEELAAMCDVIAAIRPILAENGKELLAAPTLSPSGGWIQVRKARYICIAANRLLDGSISTRWRMAVWNLKRVIGRRLGNSCSVEHYLSSLNLIEFEDHSYRTADLVQQFRHAWLNELDREFYAMAARKRAAER